MDVAAESIHQDGVAEEEIKADGLKSASVVGHSEDNKFQKAIAAWRSEHCAVAQALPTRSNKLQTSISPISYLPSIARHQTS